MKKSEYTINSVHVTPDGIPTIEYDQITEHGTKQITYKSGEKVTDDFTNVWKQLVPHFIAIAELPKTWAEPGTRDGAKEDQIVVRKIAFKRQETVGLTISATKTLQHSPVPLNITTPLKYFPPVPYEELQGDSLIYLTKPLEELVANIERETIEYLNGKHLGADQLELEAEEDSAPETALEPVPVTNRRGSTKGKAPKGGKK
ncbi:MAG: hypothetical protein JSS75_07365 [Bacteroidetes bacterium]|nr:hypothetical protein [Bacteroidota bacterium]